MKELLIEEKANRYDEAIKIAKSKIKNDKNHVLYEDDVIEIFPELTESEDDRIRKEIIAWLKNSEGQTIPIDRYNAAIAWLEKQGEQKFADKVEPKFKSGDWVIFNEHHNSVYQVEKIQGLRYYLRHYTGGSMSVHIDNQLIRYWTIQDAKDGDVLVNWNNTIYLFKGIEEEVVKFYCYYNTNYEEFNTPIDNNSHLGLTEPQFEHHPATKEQRDLLFQKMKEAGYKWDAEKKELKKIL